MLHRLQARLTYANVTATLALFLALGGGAYAAIDLVGRNDIKSKHIKNSQVKPKDINKSAEAAWIFVHDNQRINGSPGVQVTRIDPGFYRVRFPFSVRNRALLATPTDYDVPREAYVFRCGSAPGDIDCPSPHPNDARTVFVSTQEGTNSQDTTFWLAAIP